MKKIASYFRRYYISFIMLFALLLIITPIKASAGSYPFFVFCNDDTFSNVNTIVSDTANVGDVYNIRLRWFAEFKYEGYDLTISDSSYNTVATASPTWYNTTIERHITIPWDTSDLKAGVYKIEITPKFYSFYRWNEAPSSKTLTVTLKGKGSNKSNSSIAAVKKLKVKNSSRKALTVSYGKASNAKKYKIQYSLDKSFKSNVKSKTTAKTNYTIKNLKKGKTYYVRVCGINGSSQGKWSSVKKVKIKK